MTVFTFIVPVYGNKFACCFNETGLRNRKWQILDTIDVNSTVLGFFFPSSFKIKAISL